MIHSSAFTVLSKSCIFGEGLLGTAQASALTADPQGASVLQNPEDASNRGPAAAAEEIPTSGWEAETGEGNPAPATENSDTKQPALQPPVSDNRVRESALMHHLRAAAAVDSASKKTENQDSQLEGQQGLQNGGPVPGPAEESRQAESEGAADASQNGMYTFNSPAAKPEGKLLTS